MKKKNILFASVASLAVVAVTAYFIISRRRKQQVETPPANAPQVPIQNPGDQSEFPAAPSGDKDLG